MGQVKPLDILWFGRGNADYARNRVVLEAMRSLGHRVRFQRPKISALPALTAGLAAALAGGAKPDVMWVPCFRQRDMGAAASLAGRWRVPLVFDPLISAYDKQVFERRKFEAGSVRARRLLKWERRRFAQADWVVADTAAHAKYFRQTLGVPADRLKVVPVGAEAAVFAPVAMPPVVDGRIEALFYGSFIHLQGPKVIVEAAAACPGVCFTLLGDGPLKAACVAAAEGLSNVRFEEPIAYERLPERIGRAHVLLGVFAGSDKAARVVPNKVYQSLACGRPVVTRASAAYAEGLQTAGVEATGLAFVPPEDPAALAQAVLGLAERPGALPGIGQRAGESYRRFMGPDAVVEALGALLERAVR